MSGGTKARLKGPWCLGKRNSYGVRSGTRRNIQDQDGSQAIQDILRLESRVILGEGHVDSRIQVQSAVADPRGSFNQVSMEKCGQSIEEDGFSFWARLNIKECP